MLFSQRIYPISLLEGENCNNEDYCMNSIDLVPIRNDSLLTYFFDNDDEDDNASFHLLTVSNVILDCDYNFRIRYTNKKKRVPKISQSGQTTDKYISGNICH